MHTPTCFECEAERCESKLDSESIKLSDSHSVTAKLSCQEGEIRCVHDSWATLSNVTSRLDEEKKAFIISGSVTFCIIGRNEDGTPLYLENDSPFEHEIPIPENVNGEISISPELCIENCTYYLADETTAELKADIKIGGEMTIQQTGTMISELRVLTDKPKEKNDKYALKICYCNESDDIWEIAKKYSTSITAILEENELTDDKISKQGMLLIPLMN